VFKLPTGEGNLDEFVALLSDDLRVFPRGLLDLAPAVGLSKKVVANVIEDLR
jgi:hypothetical protein